MRCQPRRLHRLVGARRFCTDADLHQNLLLRGIPLAHPDEAAGRREVPAERTHATPTPTTSTPSRPTRHDGEGGRGRSKGHATRGACTDEDTGSAHTHTTTTSCMENAKRR